MENLILRACKQKNSPLAVVVSYKATGSVSVHRFLFLLKSCSCQKNPRLSRDLDNIIKKYLLRPQYLVYYMQHTIYVMLVAGADRCWRWIDSNI